MSAPRMKRQFAGAASDPAQRQITSFFSASSASPSLSVNTTSSSHAIPHSFSSDDSSVQSNLLSVGMRVRKAVPEGYKTSSYSAFSLWDENDTNSHNDNDNDAMGGRSRANAVSTPRELLPFCGLHKVGGMATQSYSSRSETPFSFSLSPATLAYQPMMGSDSMEDVPGLTLSQESTDSSLSGSSGITGAKTRKRSFTDDEDELPEIPGRLNVVGWYDGEISPRSLAPAGWGNNGRAMAVPRRGKHRGKMGHRAPGQENVMIVDGDFGEAPFLDRNWEVEMTDI